MEKIFIKNHKGENTSVIIERIANQRALVFVMRGLGGFNSLHGQKEFHIIKNAPHTFREKQHLSEIENLFLKWIDKVLRKNYYAPKK